MVIINIIINICNKKLFNVSFYNKSPALKLCGNPPVSVLIPFSSSQKIVASLSPWSGLAAMLILHSTFAANRVCYRSYMSGLTGSTSRKCFITYSSNGFSLVTGRNYYIPSWTLITWYFKKQSYNQTRLISFEKNSFSGYFYIRQTKAAWRACLSVYWQKAFRR